jgi:hypothetical protein
LRPIRGQSCRLNRLDAGPAIGLVWDLSETGVSMLMAKPPKPGAELAGELTPENGGQAVPVQLRVIHVKPMMTGDFIHSDPDSNLRAASVPAKDRERMDFRGQNRQAG